MKLKWIPVCDKYKRLQLNYIYFCPWRIKIMVNLELSNRNNKHIYILLVSLKYTSMFCRYNKENTSIYRKPGKRKKSWTRSNIRLQKWIPASWLNKISEQMDLHRLQDVTNFHAQSYSGLTNCLEKRFVAA